MAIPGRKSFGMPDFSGWTDEDRETYHRLQNHTLPKPTAPDPNQLIQNKAKEDISKAWEWANTPLYKPDPNDESALGGAKRFASEWFTSPTDIALTLAGYKGLQMGGKAIAKGLQAANRASGPGGILGHGVNLGKKLAQNTTLSKWGTPAAGALVGANVAMQPDLPDDPTAADYTNRNLSWLATGLGAGGLATRFKGVTNIDPKKISENFQTGTLQRLVSRMSRSWDEFGNPNRRMLDYKWNRAIGQLGNDADVDGIYEALKSNNLRFFDVFSDETVRDMATRHGLNPDQVIDVMHKIGRPKGFHRYGDAKLERAATRGEQMKNMSKAMKWATKADDWMKDIIGGARNVMRESATKTVSEWLQEFGDSGTELSLLMRRYRSTAAVRETNSILKFREIASSMSPEEYSAAMRELYPTKQAGVVMSNPGGGLSDNAMALKESLPRNLDVRQLVEGTEVSNQEYRRWLEKNAILKPGQTLRDIFKNRAAHKEYWKQFMAQAEAKGMIPGADNLYSTPATMERLISKQVAIETQKEFFDPRITNKLIDGISNEAGITSAEKAAEWLDRVRELNPTLKSGAEDFIKRMKKIALVKAAIMFPVTGKSNTAYDIAHNGIGNMIDKWGKSIWRWGKGFKELKDRAALAGIEYQIRGAIAADLDDSAGRVVDFIKWFEKGDRMRSAAMGFDNLKQHLDILLDPKKPELTRSSVDRLVRMLELNTKGEKELIEKIHKARKLKAEGIAPTDKTWKGPADMYGILSEEDTQRYMFNHVVHNYGMPDVQDLPDLASMQNLFVRNAFFMKKTMMTMDTSFREAIKVNPLGTMASLGISSQLIGEAIWAAEGGYDYVENVGQEPLTVEHWEKTPMERVINNFVQSATWGMYAVYMSMVGEATGNVGEYDIHTTQRTVEDVSKEKQARDLFGRRKKQVETKVDILTGGSGGDQPEPQVNPFTVNELEKYGMDDDQLIDY